MSPFNVFWGVGHPQLEFLGVSGHPQWLCHWTESQRTLRSVVGLTCHSGVLVLSRGEILHRSTAFTPTKPPMTGIWAVNAGHKYVTRRTQAGLHHHCFVLGRCRRSVCARLADRLLHTTLSCSHNQTASVTFCDESDSVDSWQPRAQPGSALVWTGSCHVAEYRKTCNRSPRLVLETRLLLKQCIRGFTIEVIITDSITVSLYRFNSNTFYNCLVLFIVGVLPSSQSSARMEL